MDEDGSAGNSEADIEEALPTRGPTYKVDVVVDCVKTRALLDHEPKCLLSIGNYFLRSVKPKGGQENSTRQGT